MKREIKTMEQRFLEKSLAFVEQVFSAHESPAEGRAVRSLVEEIRSKEYYLPQLELMMVDADAGDEIIGYVMFSRFHLEGRFGHELLLLSPAAVKTSLQRQHISKELIEYGFAEAVKMGYKAVLVEGSPQNYRARGFVTSADHGIIPGRTVALPPERFDCLMVKELIPGALEAAGIRGRVEYDFYQSLT